MHGKKIKFIYPLLVVAGFVAGVFFVGKVGVISDSFAQKFWQDSGISHGAVQHITPDLFTKLAELEKPAVVNISTTQIIKHGRTLRREWRTDRDDFFKRFFGDDFFERFFGEGSPPDIKRHSLGSGFIISEDGYILTNNHVVADATEIKVILSDEKEYTAEKIGLDPKTDIALIKIEANSALPVAKLGDSDKLNVGEWVMAIGNPFGLSRTVTVGIVSAKERVIGQGPYDDFIQTDAAINLGNSGGPLVNIYGEVIGINTAIVARGTGIGFAVPINMAKDILPELKEKGSVTRGWLGVSIQDVTPEIAESLNLRSEEGALIADIVQGDPAEKAGIERGDVIIEFDGKKVESSRKLSEIVAKTPVGKKVSVKVIRDGKEKVIKVTVGKMKEMKVARLEKAADELGMEIQDITPDLQEELGQEEGVVVIRVDPVGLASDAGIQKGDVIKEINKRKIKDIDDYRDAVSELKQGQTILFLVNRRGTNLYIALKYKG